MEGEYVVGVLVPLVTALAPVVVVSVLLRVVRFVTGTDGREDSSDDGI